MYICEASMSYPTFDVLLRPVLISQVVLPLQRHDASADVDCEGHLTGEQYHPSSWIIQFSCSQGECWGRAL